MLHTGRVSKWAHENFIGMCAIGTSFFLAESTKEVNQGVKYNGV